MSSHTRSDTRIGVGIALVLLSAGLLGCSDRVPKAPAPMPAEAVVMPAVVPASSSVPDAATVLGTTSETKQDPAAGRANKTMSRAEESTAMPLPGQNNDHSAPLPPAKPASSR